ncbi:MAG: hypothetical protein ACAF41_03210 [Leptolyngbya sp. BL-A-14]
MVTLHLFESVPITQLAQELSQNRLELKIGWNWQDWERLAPLDYAVPCIALSRVWSDRLWADSIL